MSERKKINSIVSTVLNNNDYRLNKKCLWLLIFSYLFYLLPPAVADGKAHFPSTCLLSSLMMSKKQKQEWVHRVRVLGLSKLSIVALRVVLGQTRSSLTSCGYHPVLLSE